MHSKKRIVVGGKVYADIDVLACVSAYTQLLTLKNYQANGIITGPWNQTIPPSIRKWPLEINTTFSDSIDSCCFILVDLSDPKFMEEFVSIEKVIEVYDHHYGYEMFWKEKLPNSTHVEKVGACATLIWEKFKESDLHSFISNTNANLLYTAIFANTLNFKSYVTVERDYIASEELLAYTTLPKDWKSIYYQEVAEGFNEDLSAHIKRDTKIINLEDFSFYFGQIEVWNAASIVDRFACKFNPHPNEEWLINIASIEEGSSYIYTNSVRLRHKLREIIDIKSINQHFQITSRLWLRKELLRELSCHSKT